MVARAWKVFGVEGHRQRMSFGESVKYDFSNEKEGHRIVGLINADITGTNDYSIIVIERDSAQECEDEFFAQLDDGFFENCRTGGEKEIPVPESWHTLCTR